MPTADHLGTPLGPAERAQAILRDRWLISMLIAFGVMALVVVSVIGFSGAYFSSRSTSPDNAFTAGKVRLTIARSGPIVDGSGLYPGAAKVGTQTVTNVEHRATVTLRAGGLSATSRLADTLEVIVTQTKPSHQAVYEGRLSDLGTLALGTYEKGEQRSYQVAVSWPPDQTDPSLQGTSVSFSFDWIATSVA